MGLRLYLTVAAVVAILYALAFLLIPIQASLLFSGFAEPRAVLYLRFCGAAVLVWGLIVWFARDFRDWAAVQSVLIASVVGLVANIIINVWATLGGWLNGNAWGSTVVLVLLLLGGVYELVVGAVKKSAALVLRKLCGTLKSMYRYRPAKTWRATRPTIQIATAPKIAMGVETVQSG